MIKTKCIVCNKEFKYRPAQQSGIYCSNKCQGKLRVDILIKSWLNGEDKGYNGRFRLKPYIRKYMLQKSNYKCEECGWNKINPFSKTFPLEIDHIDGDCLNCQIENLKVLCPNCHSLTSTWKALNKGKGNRKRLEYSKLLNPYPK